MNVIDGQLTGPNKQLMDKENMGIAINSLKKFKTFDIKNVITYHGSLFNDNPHHRIKELIDGN